MFLGTGAYCGITIWDFWQQLSKAFIVRASTLYLISPSYFVLFCFENQRYNDLSKPHWASLHNGSHETTENA